MRITKYLAAGVLALTASGTALATAPAAHATATGWEPHNLTYNGYAVQKRATGVWGSWVVPKTVQCRGAGLEGIWVGLGGMDNVNPLVQVGTADKCTAATGTSHTTFSWYEVAPPNSTPVPLPPGHPTSPGDSMHAAVTYRGGGNYRLDLTDVGKWFWSLPVHVSSQNTPYSADWIIEAWGPGGWWANEPDFHTVSFTNAAFAAGGPVKALSGANGATKFWTNNPPDTSINDTITSDITVDTTYQIGRFSITCNRIPSPPTNLRVAGKTSTSVTLTWRDLGKNVDGYVVAGAGTSHDWAVPGAGTRSLIWKGLRPGSTYTFWVASKSYGPAHQPVGSTGNVQSKWVGPVTVTTTASLGAGTRQSRVWCLAW